MTNGRFTDDSIRTSSEANEAVRFVVWHQPHGHISGMDFKPGRVVAVLDQQMRCSKSAYGPEKRSKLQMESERHSWECTRKILISSGQYGREKMRQNVNECLFVESVESLGCALKVAAWEKGWRACVPSPHFRSAETHSFGDTKASNPCIRVKRILPPKKRSIMPKIKIDYVGGGVAVASVLTALNNAIVLTIFIFLCVCVYVLVCRIAKITYCCGFSLSVTCVCVCVWQLWQAHIVGSCQKSFPIFSHCHHCVQIPPNAVLLLKLV